MHTATTAPLSPTDPETVGDYTLLGRLGAGGMGTVYLGRAADERLVAIKVIRREYSVDPDFTARFRVEVEHARAVASFCTAQVLAYGESVDGRPYMVTEYIKGNALDRQIATFGALEPTTLHGVAFGVAAALTAIHGAGLVHRDLKPANVILSLSGPRVIDFGIARAVDATHGDTQTGEVVGTPGWWAPEQLQGKVVTPAVDVFTWGCLVAYAGKGCHPFGEGDPMVLAHRVLEAEPDLSDLPEPLDHLVRRALRKEPGRRPTAQELLLALVSGQTEPATQILENIWGDPASPRVLNEIWGGSSASPAAGEIRDTPLSTGLPPEFWDPPPNLRPDLPRSRTRRWVMLIAAALVLALGAGLLVGLFGDQQPAASSRQRANDIGRRVDLPNKDAQVLVRAPKCRSSGELNCKVTWLMFNTGPASLELGVFPDLVDDKGVSHQPMKDLRPEAPIVEPGEVLSFTAEYALPSDRRPAVLSGSLIVGGGNVEVRL